MVKVSPRQDTENKHPEVWQHGLSDKLFVYRYRQPEECSPFPLNMGNKPINLSAMSVQYERAKGQQHEQDVLGFLRIVSIQNPGVQQWENQIELHLYRYRPKAPVHRSDTEIPHERRVEFLDNGSLGKQPQYEF